MIKKSRPNKQSILVVGLGMTGYSIIKHLAKKPCNITVADSRDLPPYFGQVKNDYPEVELLMGKIPFNTFDQYDQIIASPGVDMSEAKQLQSPLIGDIELFAQNVDRPVIAITGSNGKSTVTMLVSELLKAAGMQVKTGGNIGTPALDLLEGDSPDIFVLELSSFQLECTYSLKPASSTILNISEDHMDRYDDLDQYIDAKLKVFRHADKLVFNRDDQYVNSKRVNAAQAGISFGLDSPPGKDDFGVVEREQGRCMVRGKEILARVDQSILQGNQNTANILAAFALVESAGVALKPNVVRAALLFGGLPHRCELVKEQEDVKWINDSKGTNVGATIAAIKGFSQPVILILGGKGKGADFKPLANAISEKVIHTILFGEDAEIILSDLEKTRETHRVTTLEEAVILAKTLSHPDNVVLFSPACASFDMFDNYEHRGNVFKQLVLELVH